MSISILTVKLAAIKKLRRNNNVRSLKKLNDGKISFRGRIFFSALYDQDSNGYLGNLGEVLATWLEKEEKTISEKVINFCEELKILLENHDAIEAFKHYLAIYFMDRSNFSGEFLYAFFRDNIAIFNFLDTHIPSIKSAVATFQAGLIIQDTLGIKTRQLTENELAELNKTIPKIKSESSSTTYVQLCFGNNFTPAPARIYETIKIENRMDADRESGKKQIAAELKRHEETQAIADEILKVSKPEAKIEIKKDENKEESEVSHCKKLSQIFTIFRSEIWNPKGHMPNPSTETRRYELHGYCSIGVMSLKKPER